MKIQGLRKAVREYKDANSGGYYSPHCGYLMYDKSTGELWTDEFWSIGHNEWMEYHSDDIINIGGEMIGEGIEINERTVKEYIINNYINKITF